VTRREAGGWRWAALQLVLMSGLAWGAAFVVRRAMILLGVP
jgi:Fe2+ transport system protein B